MAKKKQPQTESKPKQKSELIKQTRTSPKEKGSGVEAQKPTEAPQQEPKRTGPKKRRRKYKLKNGAPNRERAAQQEDNKRKDKDPKRTQGANQAPGTRRQENTTGKWTAGANRQIDANRSFGSKRNRNANRQSDGRPMPFNRFSNRPHTVREPGSIRLRSDGTERADRDTLQSAPEPSTQHQAGVSGKRINRRPITRKVYNKKRDDRFREKDIQWKQKKTISKSSPVPKSIDIMEAITVSDLARKMHLKASDLISKLMEMGMMVSINEQIDAGTAEIVAHEYGCQVRIVSLYDETVIKTEDDDDQQLEPRAPIVTIMGHVDHGKTTLLDFIRTTKVVAGEFGGITQHIGAYRVELSQGSITFLDTPGHTAFTLMRSRGAHITDIVVLVVAANDGIMPQTREAIDHARAADVPIIIAVNKIDLENANPERVRQQLSDLGLVPSEWGGETMFYDISALTGQGIPELLEAILLQAEILELKANYTCNASGKIIESRIDPGRGMISTVLVQRGVLRIGDSFVAGVFSGRVRAMFDDKGQQVEAAAPSMPVEVLGFTGIPDAGDPFQGTDNEKIARQVGLKRQELRKLESARSFKRVTLDTLYDSIHEGNVRELKVVIKGDVHGSVEAIQHSLERLSTEEIRLTIISASAGAINESDVMLASASNAIIVGFHVRPTSRALELAEQEKVEIRRYNVIYEVIDSITAALEGMLEPEIQEDMVGTAEVREIFRISKLGTISGSYVLSGTIRRGAKVTVIRDGIEIYSSSISSLKRFKENVREVESGYECGIGIENFDDLKVGDLFEVYELKEVAKKLPGIS